MPVNYDTPVHLRFGYKYNQECAAIRAELIAEGFDENDLGFSFKVSKRYMENHANDLTFKERQKIWLAEQAAKHPSKPMLEFTDEELAYLLERLAGVNDPIGMDILDKLLKNQ